MRPIGSIQRCFAVVVCLAATHGLVGAEEGVVRISDADTRPGVVRLGDADQAAQPQLVVRPVSVNAPSPGGVYFPTAFGTAGAAAYGASGVAAPYHVGGYCGPGPVCNVSGYYGPGAACGPGGACPGNCGPTSQEGGCNPGSCCCGMSCPGPGCQCEGNVCMSSFGACDDCFYGPGHNQRMVRLFARATPKGSFNCARWPTRWWRGQQINYLARNQRLSNILFGWLVPSGCCGRGCPPIGSYGITYADKPCCQHPQDGLAYGAQGYGVPVTVPLPPNVRQSYNYSSGIPSSRITQIGHCDPCGYCPQPLLRRTW